MVCVEPAAPRVRESSLLVGPTFPREQVQDVRCAPDRPSRALLRWQRDEGASTPALGPPKGPASMARASVRERARVSWEEGRQCSAGTGHLASLRELRPSWAPVERLLTTTETPCLSCDGLFCAYDPGANGARGTHRQPACTGRPASRRQPRGRGVRTRGARVSRHGAPQRERRKRGFFPGLRGPVAPHGAVRRPLHHARMALQARAQCQLTVPARPPSATRTGRPVSDVAEVVERVRSETLPHLRTSVKDGFAMIRDSLEEDDRALLILRIDRQLSWRDIARSFSLDDESHESLHRLEARLRQRFRRVNEEVRTRAHEAGLPSTHDDG
jgi:hypothetical protein